MKLEFKCDIDLEDYKLNYLVKVFHILIPEILSAFVTQILKENAIELMKKDEGLPFCCKKCGHNYATWKTKCAGIKDIILLQGMIKVPQMQVECKKCKHRYYITGMMLGIDAYAKTTTKIKEAFALIGSCCPYRVSAKIINLISGVKISKSTIWNYVQVVGSKISFGIDVNESSEFQADGTGIPIIGIKKRGQELKVMVQKCRQGGVQIVGLALGAYHSISDWNKLFEPIIEDLKAMKNPILTTDGDTSILKGLKNLKIIIQRCLWHIPHQAKHTMWSDDIKRKSADWYEILSKLYNIIAVSYNGEEEDVIKEIVKEKEALLDKLLEFCLEKEYLKTYTYLFNAKPDLFNGVLKKYNCKSQSLVERVMKTVNARINVGKWGNKGALNVLRIRLAHYYNDFNVSFKSLNKKSLNIKIGG